MKLKIKLVIFLVLVMLLISTFKSTYAKYASTANGTATAQVAAWEVVLDNKDIGVSSELTQWQTNYTDVTLKSFKNDNVVDGKIAPGSTGKATIIIDASKIDVSFNINFVPEIINNANANLIISGVFVSTSVDNSTYTTRQPLVIALDFIINNTNTPGKFFHTYTTNSVPCTYIKLEVEYLWQANVNDTSDTTKGHDAAAIGGKSVQLKTALGFTQIVS